jgi:phosphopantothenoylcysteine decarboxylase/phosphopantothenate--cysteine ligase
MELKGKHILLGISGGIAAYKCGELIRQLVKSGAEVKTVVTENALQFITPMTLETLSQNQVYSAVFGAVNNRSTEHIAIAEWADLLLIAPATANCIGKMANGIADDALSTTFLAFDGPVCIAPAMNTKMYNHPIVEKNRNLLQEIGCVFIEAAEGELACGTSGKGRMEEPINIVNYLRNNL